MKSNYDSSYSDNAIMLKFFGASFTRRVLYSLVMRVSTVHGCKFNRGDSQLRATSSSLSASSAMSGTKLPRGERCRSMVPLGLVCGKSTGLSVATLARRPLGPEIVDAWPRFVIFRDALERRDDVLRCNITEVCSHPWKINDGHIKQDNVLKEMARIFICVRRLNVINVVKFHWRYDNI